MYMYIEILQFLNIFFRLYFRNIECRRYKPFKYELLLQTNTYYTLLTWRMSRI